MGNCFLFHARVHLFVILASSQYLPMKRFVVFYFQTERVRRPTCMHVCIWFRLTATEYMPELHRALIICYSRNNICSYSLGLGSFGSSPYVPLVVTRVTVFLVMDGFGPGGSVGSGMVSVHTTCVV